MGRPTVKHGARVFSAHYTIDHTMYPNTHMYLRTWYNVGDIGIKVTSTSKAGTEAWYPNTISGSTKTVDRYAQKDGYDVNTQGDYHYSMFAKGSPIRSKYYTIYNTIKLVDNHSSSAELFIHYEVY